MARNTLADFKFLRLNWLFIEGSRRKWNKNGGEIEKEKPVERKRERTEINWKK